MYSTWRSGESSGYCDLHRRGLEPTALSVDERRSDLREPLGERPTKEAAGDSRGSPFVLGFVDKESFDGRYGSVVAIFGGVGRRDDCSGSGDGVEVHACSRTRFRQKRRPIRRCSMLVALSQSPRSPNDGSGGGAQKKGDLHSGGDRR